MLKAAGIQDEEVKYGIWAELASTTADLDNIMVSTTREHSPYYQFYGKHPPFAKHLKTFGEIGIVTIHDNKRLRSKFDSRGKPCIFVSYPKDTTGDVYRMLSLQTRRVLKSKNIIWLNKSCGTYQKRHHANVDLENLAILPIDIPPPPTTTPSHPVDISSPLGSAITTPLPTSAPLYLSSSLP
jgi:hypothetical protein